MFIFMHNHSKIEHAHYLLKQVAWQEFHACSQAKSISINMNLARNASKINTMITLTRKGRHSYRCNKTKFYREGYALMASIERKNASYLHSRDRDDAVSKIDERKRE